MKQKHLGLIFTLILIFPLIIPRVFAQEEKTNRDFLDEITSFGSGETVFMEKDAAIPSGKLVIHKDLIIDLKGHTLSAASAPKGLSYLISHTGGKLTIRNGKILSDFSGGITSSKGTLNLENVEIKTLRRSLNLTGRSHCSVDSRTSLTTTGSGESSDACVKLIAKYEGWDWGERVWFNCAGKIQTTDISNLQPAIGGNVADVGIVHVTLADGAKISSHGTTVFLPQRCTLEVGSATITGQSGIECRQGSVTIHEGAKIFADYTQDLMKMDDSEEVDLSLFYDEGAINGSAVHSCALAIAQQIGGESLSVTINGGSFSGTFAICALDIDPRPDTGVNQPKTTVKIVDGFYDGYIYNRSKALKRSVVGGCYRKKPSPYFNDWQEMIFDNNTLLYYVADAAHAFLGSKEAVGHRIELMATSDLNNVVPGVTLINRNTWDVKVNLTEVLSNGREMTVISLPLSP